MEWVNKYIIPLAGDDREDVFRGYASAENKQKYLAKRIWDRYGDKFTDEDEWGRNTYANFMHIVADSTRVDVRLEYLVDELGVLKK